jgi:hypothetical protein
MEITWRPIAAGLRFWTRVRRGNATTPGDALICVSGYLV